MMKPKPFLTSNHFTVPTNIGPPTKLQLTRWAGRPCVCWTIAALLPHRRLAGMSAATLKLCLHEVSLWAADEIFAICNHSNATLGRWAGPPRNPADHPGYKCPSRSPESNVICRPGKDPANTYPDARSVAAYFDHWVKDWQVGSGQNGRTSEMCRKSRG